MTNQIFCYWLQGYFEISSEVSLTEEKLVIIKRSLDEINEPLGVFTQWLHSVVIHLESKKFRQSFLDLFLPEIKNRLNAIFFHVIDTSYDRNTTLEEARQVHYSGIPVA